MTAGLDLGDKHSPVPHRSTKRRVMEEGRLRTTPEALRRRFASEQHLRIAMKSGTLALG